MTIKEKFDKVMNYIYDRMGENSTYRGMLVCVSSFSGWKATGHLDWNSTNLLEAVTWGGLFAVGLINIFRNQSK